jgi:hypothetical protein
MSLLTTWLQFPRTLLHWAAFKNYRDMCTLLLRHNADILIRDSIGNTPFQLACSSGADDTVTLLMERMKKHDAGWAFNTGRCAALHD